MQYLLSNIAAPPAMVSLFNDRSTNLKRAIELQNMHPSLPRIMNAVSEWSALLDYCELLPLRLSKARLTQDEPIQPLWIVGGGEFGSTNSPSILSVPSQTWRPELIFLGEKWMVDYPLEHPNLDHYFLMSPWTSESIEHGVDGCDVLERWRLLGTYAPSRRYCCRIFAGMVVNHEFPVRGDDPGSLLNWIPKAYVESLMGGNIRVVLGKSKSLK
eukprot:scaffold8797_cov83-Skeletonema_marinoi.AAC.1